jgi:hypothetical protein
MTKLLTGMLALAFIAGCGPAVDDEPEPVGELALEYEDSRGRLYRLDRRVEVIYDYEREDGLQEKCGFLTDRAYDELESTLAALDPSADDGDHPADCDTYGALVYIDGFEHSPFECTHECCHRDLVWAAVVYSMILNNFHGGYPTTGMASRTSPSSPTSRAPSLDRKVARASRSLRGPLQLGSARRTMTSCGSSRTSAG